MTPELAIRILSGDTLGTASQTNEAVKMAIEALASRIPKKVKMELNEFGTKYRLSCPACDEYFGHMWVHDTGIGIMPLYCDCGQRLDWSDVDANSAKKLPSDLPRGG